MVSSAYGKIILLGEHAVVYGYPALCGALSQGVTIKTVPGTGRIHVPAWEAVTPPLTELLQDLPQIHHQNLPQPPLSGKPILLGTETQTSFSSIQGLTSAQHQSFSAQAPYPSASLSKILPWSENLCQAYIRLWHWLLDQKRLHPAAELPYDFVVDFQIPTGAGLGASAALSVALVRMLDQTHKLHLTPNQIREAAYQAEQVFHGNHSGLDVTLAQQGGFGVYRKPQLYPMRTTPIPLCIGYTGKRKDTKARVAHVAHLMKTAPLETEACLQHIATLVESGKQAVLTTSWQTLGDLMNQNQAELRKLDASSPEIETLCTLALQAGALGAKLTGGGGGGCVIALGPGQEQNILSSWQLAGFSAFLTSLGSPSSCNDE